MFHPCAVASFKQNGVVKRVEEAEHGQPVKTLEYPPLNNSQETRSAFIEIYVFIVAGTGTASR